MSLSASSAAAVLAATSPMLRLKASPVGEKPKGDRRTIDPLSSMNRMACASTLRVRPVCW